VLAADIAAALVQTARHQHRTTPRGRRHRPHGP
jgi:hypothetical protein